MLTNPPFLPQPLISHPFRIINFADPVDKVRHDRIVALVTQMLDLNKKLQDAKLNHEKTVLARQIEATDASIDKLVYELYGLTPEEIAIVEENEIIFLAKPTHRRAETRKYFSKIFSAGFPNPKIFL
jgi:hypothetical protein